MADDDVDPAAQLLSNTKNWATVEIVNRLDGLTTNQYGKYPRAEVQSWTFQAAEASVFAAAEAATPGSGTLAMTPFLVAMCTEQYGDADDATRLTQVQGKVTLVTATQAGWFGIGAFVAGLRAKVDDQILAATTPEDVTTALANAEAEIAAFQAANGL